MTDEQILTDEKKQQRTERADQYFNEDLKGQRKWYSNNAGKFKKRHQLISFFIIAAGSLIAVASVVFDNTSAPVATAILGAAVAIAKGGETIARYEETWQGYRVASEKMKREFRLYTNSAGEYRDIADEEEAYLFFVETVERIIAEEQKFFWDARASDPSKNNKADAAKA